MARALELDRKSRNELVEEARGLGLERPERLTRVELVDEIIRRTTPSAEQAEARGLFGVARSMLASMVESGLKLPEAASVIRGTVVPRIPVANQSPVATVTLAEIYAAQGHRVRALRMIEEVLRSEPDHEEARRIRQQLQVPLDAANAIQKDETLPAAASARVAVEPGESLDYQPGGFVETTGEEIQTGKPPATLPHLTSEFESSSAEPLATVDPPATTEIISAEQDFVPEYQLSEVEVPHSQRPTELPRSSDEVELAGRDVLPPSLIAAPALVLHETEQRIRLYWELPAAVLEHCGVDQGEGQAALRLVTITPAGSHPQRGERTFLLHEGHQLSPDHGWIDVEPIQQPVAVRAALGWLAADSFLPICVAKTAEQWAHDSAALALVERAQPHLK